VDQPARAPQRSLGVVLARLRDVVQAQANALAADDFEGLERLTADRERLVHLLDGYTAADRTPADLPLLEQVAALDERLTTLAQTSLDQTSHELGEVRRGRGVLTAYQKRGESLIRNLARMNYER
jgi:hypothetical protein